MRKLNFFLALGLLLASLCANAANEVYSIVQGGNTLVFYYDGNRETYPQANIRHSTTRPVIREHDSRDTMQTLHAFTLTNR